MVSVKINLLIYLNIDCKVQIVKFRGDPSDMAEGNIVEIRGIANQDNTINYGEHTVYDKEFDLATYEHMLTYYHGMCKELVVK